jgi:hypothetical protein
MLKVVSRKSLLLLGVVLASCAFVVPSVASAASWFPVGTSLGRLDWNNFGFSMPAIAFGMTCAQSPFSLTVDSAAVATITGANFVNCHGDSGFGLGCTTTTTGTFPWRVTVPDTTHVIVHVDADVSFETTPGTPNECSVTGTQIRFTGAATASFTSGAAGTRTFDFGTGVAGGFVADFDGGSIPAVLRGRAVATGLLNVIM